MTFPKDPLRGLFSRYETLFLLALALIVILSYANTLGSPFIFDSRNNIESNPHIRISEITLNNLADAAFKSPEKQRPLSNISFALNYYLNGYNVVGYHVVNILIHISTGFILYFFVKATLCTPALRSRHRNDRWISFFAAAVWMIHPLQTQSVSYIVQRMNSLCAMFYILSILLYARFRLNEQQKNKWWLFSGCILAGALSLASKQIAATLPVFIVLYEWYFFRDLDLKWLKNHIPLLTGCLLLAAVIALALLGGNPLDPILKGYNGRDFTLTQRLLTEPRVIMFYLSLLLWPHPSRLNLDHDFTLSNSLTDPWTTFFAILTIAALIGLAVATAKKQRLFSFCILWFFGNLVIESSFIALEIVFEHRVYLPSMAFSLIVALVAYRWVKPRWLQAALLGIMVTFGAVFTYERNTVYSDRVTFWQDCVNKSPRKARPYNNLGVALADQGHHKEAIGKYRTALEINPHYADPVGNIGLSLAEQGRVEESIGYFLKALELKPKDYKTLNNLGASLIVMHRHTEAVQYLSKALTFDPYYANAHNNLAVALQFQGRVDEAIKHFSIAVKLDPNYARAYNNLGKILASQGRFEEAIEQFSAALKIIPAYESARLNLEKSLKALNE
ncbi:MAG: tetratricopeptide repeat protein [Deltaproteobacteria bacterium]|jgi:tetratricopeptide (TPR) repeat protein